MDLVNEADRLERLARDLRLMHTNGGEPTVGQLERAPVLYEWRRVRIAAPAFVGVVDSHPKLGSHRRVSTTQVWAAGSNWIRTVSRFYLLSNSEE